MLNKEKIKFGVVAFGSNGDIEILMALVFGLLERGHEVQVFIITVNDRDYTHLNSVVGLTVVQHPFHGDYRVTEDTDVEFWRKSFEDKYDLTSSWFKKASDFLVEHAIRLAQTQDIVIGSQHVHQLSSIAEKYQTPYVSIRTYPGEVRSSYDKPIWSSMVPNSEEKTNDELWDACELYTNRVIKRSVNKLRKQLGLTKADNVTREVINSNFLNLISYSKHLFQRKPDWLENIHLCGFFKPPQKYAGWNPSEQLMQFISGTEKVVLLSLGSMSEYENDLPGFSKMLIAAAKKMKAKVIYHSNWNEEEVDGNVYKLSGFIHYPTLLNNCDLTIHHAGVGTAHIVAESGTPSVIITYGFEQPFNARTFEELGISAGQIDRNDLTPDLLSEKVNMALEMRELNTNAQSVAEKLMNENGVEDAVSLIESAYSGRKQNMPLKNEIINI